MSTEEVACPYPEADQDKLPWRYFVSVSNDGVDQSETYRTVVYNSKCHACKDNGECEDNVHEVRPILV